MKCFIAEIMRVSEEFPDREAFRFIKNGAEDAVLTYGSFVSKSKSFSVALNRKSGGPDPVAILLPTGPEYVISFFGCLLANKIPVPLYPVKVKDKNSRISAVISDCKAKFAICQKSNYPLCVEYFANENLDDKCDLFVYDEKLSNTLDTKEDVEAVARHFSYLQYTSGSTGNPKGVYLSAKNVISNLDSLVEATDCNEKDIFANWLPLFHDLGLVNTVLLPLYLGAKSVVLDPSDFVKNPSVWLRIIDKYRATICGCPNFGYDLCIKSIDEKNLKNIDLSCWEIAFNAGEPVRKATIDSFCQKYSNTGFSSEAFYPSYGMAEATVFISGGRRRSRPKIVAFSKNRLGNKKVEKVDPKVDVNNVMYLVGCGTPTSGHKIKIVELDGNAEVKHGETGEVWVSGPSVSQGYWEKKKENQNIFRNRLIGDSRIYLKTGDIGFLYDNELFLVDRNKDLIIIRGKNYYPNDIESTLRENINEFHVGAVVAFSENHDGDERLIVAMEVRPNRYFKKNEKILVDFVRACISEYFGLSLHQLILTRMGKIPRTTSGKVQRSKVKEMHKNSELHALYERIFVDGKRRAARKLDLCWGEDSQLLELDVIKAYEANGKLSGEVKARGLNTPESHRVIQLVERIWSYVLEQDLDVIQAQGNFYSLGGDSIKAVEISELLRQIGFTIETKDILKFPVLGELVKLIVNKDQYQVGFRLGGDAAGAIYSSSSDDGNKYSPNIYTFILKEKINIEMLRSSVECVIEKCPVFQYGINESGVYVPLKEKQVATISIRIGADGKYDLEEGFRKYFDSVSAAESEENKPVILVCFYDSNNNGIYLGVWVFHERIDTRGALILLSSILKKIDGIESDEKIIAPIYPLLESSSNRTYGPCHKVVVEEKHIELAISALGVDCDVASECGERAVVSVCSSNKIYNIVNNIQYEKSYLYSFLVSIYVNLFMRNNSKLNVTVEFDCRSRFSDRSVFGNVVGPFVVKEYLEIKHGSSGLEIVGSADDKKQYDDESLLVVRVVGEIEFYGSPEHFSLRADRRASMEIILLLSGGCIYTHWVTGYPKLFRGDKHVIEKIFGGVISINEDVFSRERTGHQIHDIAYKKEYGIPENEIRKKLSRIVDREIEFVCPLTSTQEEILYHCLNSNSKTLYFEQVIIKFDSKLNIEKWRKAWSAVVGTHPALRQGFSNAISNSYCSVIYKNCESFSAIKKTDIEEAGLGIDNFESAVLMDRQKGIDINSEKLSRCSLLSGSGGKNVFLWSFHHIILDGWSVSKILEDVSNLYCGQWRHVDRESDIISRYKATTLDLVENTKSDVKHVNFWKQYLEGHNTLQLNFDKGSLGDSYESTRGKITEYLPETKSREIEGFCKTNGVTLNGLIKAAYSIVLSLYSGATDVIFGETFSGRTSSYVNLSDYAGVTIRTVPSRILLNYGDSLIAVAKRAMEDSVDKIDHIHCASSSISSNNSNPMLPLYDTIINVNNYPVNTATFTKMGISEKDVVHFGESPTSLAFVVVPSVVMGLHVSYDVDRYDGKRIHRFFSDVIDVIDIACKNNETKVMAVLESLRRKNSSRGNLKKIVSLSAS